MFRRKRIWFYMLVMMGVFALVGCGGNSSTGADDNGTIQSKDDNSTSGSGGDSNNSGNADGDGIYGMNYKGLYFYHKNKASSEYKLNQLTDDEFNALSDETKLSVANKLTNTLFFGYPISEMKGKIDGDRFLSGVRAGLDNDTTDKEWLENYILDDEYFKQYQNAYYQPQVIKILTRFYAAKKLDKYFLNNWIAYILTQTILFSPAYELASTHTPDISRVYNRIVTMLEVESGMRYITYVHMMSEDNWRRFRSPEDNGREMLEIYLMDADDTHVPLAGKALQNWKLNTDSDTLEVGLNRNTDPISLFGTIVYSGEDFFRELAKSDAFTRGVTTRLVSFFFPEKSGSASEKIVSSILSSNPETWQDILLQIVFSEEYLLHNNRAQSAEETFYSLSKKIDYRAGRNDPMEFKRALESMHQASMKYKLGKLERVPVDTLSFAYYHKFVRENLLLRKAKESETDRGSWSYHGWRESFIGFGKFTHDTADDVGSLKSFVDYIFELTIGRKADSAEQALFESHMIESRDGKRLFKNEFNMFITHDDADNQAKKRDDRKENIAIIVLDYISRLQELYMQREES